jgi:CheY-like chemotaxis protein
MDKFKTNRLAPKMLIADDDPCVLRAVADRCTRMGFDVETATSGLQALIKASQHQPDVLVIDVHMPEVDGLSVLAYLQEIEEVTPRGGGYGKSRSGNYRAVRRVRRFLHPQGK